MGLFEVIQAVEALDTGNDILGPSLPDLFHRVGIRDGAAGHGNNCLLYTSESMLSFFPGATQEDLLDGCGWAVDNLKLSTHTGTHLDAPFHYHPTMNHGKPAWTIDRIPLEWCMGDGVMVDFSDKPDGYVCNSADFIEYFDKVGYRLKVGDIVLVLSLIHISAK